MKYSHLLWIAFYLTIIATQGRAQIAGGDWEKLYEFGASYLDWNGYDVAAAGDVNADGAEDIIVGAYYADPNSMNSAGTVYVYSGATGDLLWEFHGEREGDHLGHAVSCAGDVDDDGFDDVILGAPFANSSGRVDSGSAYVYSGATGNLIWRFDGLGSFDRLGHAVASAGDVDGDGFDDLIAGAPYAYLGGNLDVGSAFVYSGATGAVLWRVDGIEQFDSLGYSVAGVGDANGDLLPDVAIGTLYGDHGSKRDQGIVTIYSGATGAHIRTLEAPRTILHFSKSLANAGDVNGDGKPDLLVSAPPLFPNLPGDSYVFVYSGEDASLLWNVSGPGDFGHSVAGAGDVDGDGFDDFLVGAPLADLGNLDDAGSVHLFSGRTGEELHRFDGQFAGARFGNSVDGIEDANKDGIPDVLIGAPLSLVSGHSKSGGAYVWSFNPYLYMDAAELSVSSGRPVQLEIDFPKSEADFNFAVLASLEGVGSTLVGDLQIPLSADDLLIRMLNGEPPANLRGVYGTLDAHGDARALVLSHPLLAPLVGKTYFIAAISYRAAIKSGRLISNVRPLTIVP